MSPVVIMDKLLLLLVLVGALVSTTGATFQQKPFRCTGSGGFGFGASAYTFNTFCIERIPKMGQTESEYNHNWVEMAGDERGPGRLLDFIEECTCMLLSMSMIWETMLTHEIEVLYAVSREFVQEFNTMMEGEALKIEEHNKKVLEKIETEKALAEKQGVKYTPHKGKKWELKTFNIVRRNNPLFTGDDGDTLYHYYVLYYIVKSAQTPSAKRQFISKIMQRFASNYFDLQHLESAYKSETEFPSDHPIALTVAVACRELKNSFEPYLMALSQMRKAFTNDMWTYRVVSHDETLFKLVIASMLCQEVNEHVSNTASAKQAAVLG